VIIEKTVVGGCDHFAHPKGRESLSVSRQQRNVKPSRPSSSYQFSSSSAVFSSSCTPKHLICRDLSAPLSWSCFHPCLLCAIICGATPFALLSLAGRLFSDCALFNPFSLESALHNFFCDLFGLPASISQGKRAFFSPRHYHPPSCTSFYTFNRRGISHLYGWRSILRTKKSTHLHLEAFKLH
jgi:hypothetical protein